MGYPSKEILKQWAERLGFDGISNFKKAIGRPYWDGGLSQETLKTIPRDVRNALQAGPGVLRRAEKSSIKKSRWLSRIRGK